MELPRAGGRAEAGVGVRVAGVGEGEKGWPDGGV